MDGQHLMMGGRKFLLFSIIYHVCPLSSCTLYTLTSSSSYSFFFTNIHSDEEWGAKPSSGSGKSGKGSSGKSGKASVDEKDDGWNGGGVITKAESEMKFSQSNINSASALRIAVPLVAAVVGGAVTLL